MSQRRRLTFALMDGPFEQARTTTLFRLLEAAARRGFYLHVFAYEGAVGLTFAAQAPHPNSVHGRDAAEEDHPLPREWVSALLETAARSGGSVDWINCGLCVDERGMSATIDGVRRGTPKDLWTAALASDNTLVVGTH